MAPSHSNRPIHQLLDLLSRRWTLRVLWELRDGPVTFRQLQDKADQVSPTVLNTRLAELRRHHIVDRGEHGYQLTERGAELASQLIDLHRWAERWIGDSR